MVTEGTVHPKAVRAKVSWTQAPTGAESDAGLETEDSEVTVFVQPELKLPSQGPQGLDWASSDNAHPFWFIQRTQTDEQEANAHLVHQDLTHVVACSFKPLSSFAASDLAPFTETCTVSVPCIVNTKPIEPGAEVVLLWELPRKDKRKAETVEDTAFDQIKKRELKRLAKGKGKRAAK